MSTRRRFIEILPLAGLSLLAACSDKTPAPAAAPAPPPSAPPAPAATPVEAPTPAAAAAPQAAVDPAEPAAVALGYVADASQADKAKYKTYVAGQACANCALYAGKTGDATGPCPLFAGRQVAAKGWCSAYAKKAG